MNSQGKEIYVYAHWKPMDKPILMGRLYAELLRGKEIFSFSYDNEWIKSKSALYFDPDLQLFIGRQYLKDEKENFGLFLDSSPDRWGKVLMQRKEAALARQENRRPRKLFTSDYLIGVYDKHRLGAIRYKTDPKGPFLNDDINLAAPPFASLRDLEVASLELEKDNSIDDPHYLQLLNLLLAPGSSLGGTRPKASIVDKKGQLFIAKFPSKNDVRNIGAWEKIVSELAREAGINMAESYLRKFSSQYHTFITKRFDRASKNQRIHFASAMTLLGHTDGYDFNEGASYLEIVEFIISHGAMVEKDLKELWQRIVFSICISNTDDHLRNHGFLMTNNGWILSPAYDINPNESGTGLSLNISENDNSLDLDLALEVAAYFRLPYEKAKSIIKNIVQIVSKWEKLARKYHISHDEIDFISPAFLSS